MKWYYIVIVGVLSIALGYLIRSTITPKPQTIIKEKITHDTIKTKPIIKIYRETIPILERDTAGNIQTISDSIKGVENEVEYNIKYTYRKDTTSVWEVNVMPLLTTITEYITSDTTKTITKTKFIPKPFFVDEYFYSTIATIILLIIAIIY